MVPADAAAREGYRNKLFDFGASDGVPVDPETGMPAPGMTEFFRPGDGDRPGLFDIDKIRANEDGGLPAAWYRDNEPVRNFRFKGRGKWRQGKAPKVEIMPGGHVGFIDDATKGR